MAEFSGKNALILGLGVNQGGAGVARYLVEQGAHVRVTDMQGSDRLTISLEALEGLPISYTLGRHDEADIAWADFVVRNPGVPQDSNWLQMARERGARIEMEMTLFFRACRSPIIGVTGTKGKTTTATIIGTLLQERWPEARIAGNMGRSAVLELASLNPDVPVVLEISSFQIEGLIEQHMSPHVAVITNVSEDHLDRYASFEAYARVKADLARFQSTNDWLVYLAEDERLAGLVENMAGQPIRIAADDPGGFCAFWIENGEFVGRWKEEPLEYGAIDRLSLPGRHAQLNALAAIAAAMAVGVSPIVIRRGLEAVVPVQDRLEPVATVDGVDYVNDTTATVPVAAMAALQAFEGKRLVVIAGGSEKHLSFDAFADALAARTDAVVLLDGDATPRLRESLESRLQLPIHGPFGSMAEAVEQASGITSPGGVVLLSPGCASFGMFQNEFDRGRQFREAVHRLQARMERASK